MALVTGLSVAWLKLGSSTFQVPRLASAKATPAKRPMPAARPAWRRTNAWMPCPVSVSASGAETPERM